MGAIEGIGWPTAARLPTRPAATAPGFSVPLEPHNAAQTAETTPTQAASLTSVLTLQELGSETVEDREARRRGHDMLAELAALQRALLRGGDDISALRRLAELAQAVPYATDRQLAAMVSAILVRVRVELARRGA